MSRFSLGTNTHTIKDFRIAVRQLENMTPVTSTTKHGVTNVNSKTWPNLQNMNVNRLRDFASHTSTTKHDVTYVNYNT